MTSTDPEIALEKRFDLYRWYKNERGWYAAAVQLAEILHVSASLPVWQQAAWKTRIEKEELSEAFLREVRNGLRNSIERTYRILSIGTEWTGEEIMLVMQLRIEVLLVSDFLGNGVVDESLVQLKQVDEWLASLEKSKTHSRHFDWGLRQMKKHWMPDIELIWRSIFTDTYASHPRL